MVSSKQLLVGSGDCPNKAAGSAICYSSDPASCIALFRVLVPILPPLMNRNSPATLSLLIASLLLTAAHVRAAEPTAFQVQVTGQGDPVIFIPGFTCPGSVWDATVDKIKSYHQCHVITIAGFAGIPSSGVEPILAGVRDQLIAYIHDKQLDHPAIVGHSLGGFLGLWVGEKEPAIARKIIVVDAPPFLGVYFKPDATVETIKPIAEKFKAGMQNDTQEEFRTQNTAFLQKMISSREQANRLGEETGKSDPKVAGEAYYELLTSDLRPELNKIESPVVVIGALAGKPATITNEQAIAFIKAQYSGAKRVDFSFFENSHHFVFFDEPDKWITVLKSALE
jgi:N-formylmaleamate deformylase